MNRTNQTDLPEPGDALPRGLYQAPQLIPLNEVDPETGNVTNFNENTGGMLES
jgi:hypothetical protein